MNIKNKIKGVAKDEPIETNENGGRQSVSPYAMHLIDPEFLKNYLNYRAINPICHFMKTGDKTSLLIAFNLIADLIGASKDTALLEVSKVRKEGCDKYPPQNWRLIPQEEHINHALVHYLAFECGDRQDDHLEHCLCRLMFAYCTEVSEGFSYL